MSSGTRALKHGYAHARLDLESETLRQSFNREPFGFSHNLSDLDLFKFDSLHALAVRIAREPHDYFVQASAPSPGTRFFSVPHVAGSPYESLENLDRVPCRILLKRAENHDPRFKELIQALFKQVTDSLGGLGNEKVVRLESGILISSAATITSFHFDPEIGFFSQIEGEKMYHVYSPTVIGEREVERVAISGPVSLAPVELTGRDPAREYVFNLNAGKGFHQPLNSPHWVETGKSRSISYTFVFETESTRAAARTRAFNHYLRKVRLNPAPVGAHPKMDALKGDAMRGLIPVRQRVARIVNKIRYG